MGCIVDPIRYPYRTTMRFHKDSGVETPVCWYFCSPEAKPLGCYTRFGSGLYGKDYMDKWEGVGEVAFGPLDFRPECCQYPGKGRVGTAEQFAEGVKLADAPPPVQGLFVCSDPDLTRIDTNSPRWLDVPHQPQADNSSAYEWWQYPDSGIGYIWPNSMLTLTCENDPSLNGSWELSWVINPGVSGNWWTGRFGILPGTTAPQPTPMFQVSPNDTVGASVVLTAIGETFPFYLIFPLTGSPRPVSYSGSSDDATFGHCTATLTALPPLVPPPYPP